MEAEYHKLKPFPSFKYKIDTVAVISRQGSETDDIPRQQKLRAVPSFKHIIDSTAAVISREGSETDELPRYTSLKDVMANSSPPAAGSGADIAIRNELVKHAASAYVLSAATVIIPANRDRDSRIKMCCLGFLSCWQIHVGLPLEALCWPLVDFVYHLVRRVRNGLRGVVEII